MSKNKERIDLPACATQLLEALNKVKTDANFPKIATHFTNFRNCTNSILIFLNNLQNALSSNESTCNKLDSEPGSKEAAKAKKSLAVEVYDKIPKVTGNNTNVTYMQALGISEIDSEAYQKHLSFLNFFINFMKSVKKDKRLKHSVLGGKVNLVAWDELLSKSRAVYEFFNKELPKKHRQSAQSENK